MRYPLLPTLLALSWPLAAGAVDAPAGLFFQHHDWVVACDNTRTCRAAGYASGDDSTLSVLLTRAGGPNQAGQTLQEAKDQKLFIGKENTL